MVTPVPTAGAPGVYRRLRDGAESAVVCFPWAGAGALPFRGWAASAAPGVALWAARPAGREDRLREPPPQEWSSLVAELVDQLPALPPFVFFGHCLGALLAFEVTRELRRRGRPQPERLLVVGSAPWMAVPRDGPVDVRTTVRETGAMADEILDDPEIFRMLAPAIAADLSLVARYEYRPAPPLALPIDMLVARAESFGPAADQLWAGETTDQATTVIVDGDNLFPHGSWLGLAEAVFERATMKVGPG